MYHLIYRNIRARDQLEIFLISAASSLLLVRLYLYIADYPQIGSGGLHIAHMLWGGLLMLAAIVIALSLIGKYAEKISAIVGGVGFGVFIDELGKFITRDNNYFYQPTIGIIYAIFIGLYLSFNFISRRQKLHSREYQMNALLLMEEAIAHDMDRREKLQIQKLLKKADQKSPITKDLLRLVDDIKPVKNDSLSKLTHLRRFIDDKYESFWEKRASNDFIKLLFIALTVVFVGVAVWSVYVNLDEISPLLSGDITYAQELVIAQLFSSALSGIFVVSGILQLASSRREAFEQFRIATLINIFLTQFFVFSRVELEALPGFVVSLLLLGFINYTLSKENREVA